jgi:hypothetical protein
MTELNYGFPDRCGACGTAHNFLMDCPPKEQVVTTTVTTLDGDRRIGVEYRVGDEVEVLNGGLGTWQPATISAIRGYGFEVLTGKPEQTRLAFIFQVRRAR